MLKGLSITFGLLLVLGFIAASGTVRALPSYNQPAKYRLLILSKPMRPFILEIHGTEVTRFPVRPDGSVTIDIPVLPRRCSWRCFGFTVIDGSPKTRKVVYLMDGGEIVARYSVRQLESIPADSAGERRLRL